MKNHHEVGHFKTRLMILLLSLVSIAVMAGESIAATTCSTCHGMPPLDSADGSRDPATGAFKGSHQVHVSGPAVAADCTSCHSDATGYDMKHSATSGNVIRLTPNIYSKGSFFNQTSMPIMGTCSNVICHSNVYGSGAGTSPEWGSTGNGCSACHSVTIDSTGPATGSHAVHNTTDCSKCHDGATNNAATPTANHADGDIDVTGGYPATAKHAAGTYAADAKCSTASCHADVYSPTGTVVTPAWGTAAGCEACHTVTIATTGPATGSHAAHNTADCAQCHAGATNNSATPTANHADGDIDVTGGYPTTAKHAAGTYAADAKCSTASCHADVYSPTGTVVTPVWGASSGCEACHSVTIATTGPATGSHAAHNKTDCAQCHAGATNNTATPTANHADGDIDVTGGYPATAKHAAGTYAANAKCSTASCHADVYSPTGNVLTPAWGTAAGCDACHTVTIATTGPATGSHAAHNKTDCSKCHAGATNNTATPTANHADGDIDVTGGYPATAKHAAGTYAVDAKCSTASCHADVYSPTGTVVTPAWGTAAGCEACHTIAIGVNGPATGSHTAHAGKACITCHAAGTTDTTAPTEANGHIDGNVDVFYFGYPPDVAKHSAGTYTGGTCSTANCHSNGRGTYAPVTWGSTSTGCNFCHPNLSAGHSVHVSTLLSEISFYNYTATSSVGGTYKFGCANCHPLSVTNHLNGAVDVDLTASVSGGHLKALNGAWTYTSSQCNNVYCHSNGYKPGASFTYATTPAWGSPIAGDRCAACHGNSPNSGIVGSPAHSAHVVGIHVDDIFNGVSKKLPIGGGNAVNAAHGRNNRSTTINCNICHNATVTSSANDKNNNCSGCHDGATPPGGNKNILDPLTTNAANHVNGKVDVSFINQKIATKAQLANSAFAGYTAANAGGWSRNSNSMTFKTYTSSYDVSKSTLFASASWSQADGCANVACHNGKTVKWTDTVSCTNCHTRLK